MIGNNGIAGKRVFEVYAIDLLLLLGQVVRTMLSVLNPTIRNFLDTIMMLVFAVRFLSLGPDWSRVFLDLVSAMDQFLHHITTLCQIGLETHSEK